MSVPRFLKNIVTDLLEKKLWPVALLLVAALVALPLTLGRTSDPGVVAGVAPLPVGDDKEPEVATYNGVDTARTKDGAVRDPFIGPGEINKPEAPAPVAGAPGLPADSVQAGASVPLPAPAATGGAGVDVPSGSVPGLDDVGVVPVGGSDDRPAAKAKPDANAAYSVDLRFGQDGKLAARTDVPRLSPLPSAEDPFFVFLGVLADGKTAAFLVSSDAEATGDGTCLPTPENCERVEMQAGQTEFFDVVTPAGETVQYQLDVVRVQRERKASAAVAAAARAREDAAGRKVLRNAVHTDQVDVSDLAYSEDLGLVVPSGVGQQRAGSLFGGYRVDLRFGAPDRLVKRYNLARLTPLPSVDEPSFVYLGVLADGERAIFLNPSEAASSGDGVCDPSPEDCQRVTLKQGESALFDVATLAGGVTQYQLDLDAITPLKADTPEEAEASRSRESVAGRVILRRLITEVGTLVADLNYSADEGHVEENRPEQPKADPQAPPAPGLEPEAVDVPATD